VAIPPYDGALRIVEIDPSGAEHSETGSDGIGGVIPFARDSDRCKRGASPGQMRLAQSRFLV
jgi:hypothetical protein